MILPLGSIGVELQSAMTGQAADWPKGILLPPLRRVAELLACHFLHNTTFSL